MSTVIAVENLSKAYHLGQIGTGTFTNDLKVWYARLRGRSNPLLKIGEKDHGNRDGEELWALRNVSFNVGQGEVLGIIGRNGAGKSTLLKILSRVTAPTSGRVKVKGRIASLLEVGTGFHPELTGRENIYLNGAILGMSKADIARRFNEIIGFAGVEKFIDTPVKRYSSGMYVRLAFAVAAHLEPEILVVDEVLAVGDAEFQRKCLGKMNDVAEQGRTVLLVSHNMLSVKALCKDSIWMDKGQIVKIGRSDQIVDEYLTQDSENIVQNLFDDSVTGDGTVRLLSYEISGDEDGAVHTNGKLKISISIESDNLIQYPACGIGFYSEKGALLSSINTVELGKSMSPIPPGRSTILISMDSVPYLPGRYVGSFWIMNPQRHIYANADRKLILTIDQSTVYGTSHIDDRWGSVYIPVSFSVGAI